MKYIFYNHGLLLVIFLCLFIVKCSNNPTPRQPELQEQPEHIFILDEIPQHIREVENLSIFPGDSEPRYSIELIPEQVYGETGEPYLTTLYDAVVDDQGRVIILNANTNTNHEHSIYVYDENGTFHTQLGRHGRGPGEYGFVIDLQFKAGKVFVRDMTNKRINIYNTEGYDFDRSMLIEQLVIRDHEEVKGMNLGLTFARNDGNYFVNFSQQGSDTYIYLLMDRNGKALDFDPLEFPSYLSIRVPDRPMAPSLGLGLIMGQTLTTINNKDVLYTIWTRDFLIKKYDSNGIYQSSIYYPIQGVPFDLDEYVQTAPFGYNARDIEKGLESIDIELPETNPILDNLMVDEENRIWAAVPMDPLRENYEWWILAPSGELLAKLQRPRNKTIFDIKNGYLYAKEIDDSTDVEFVVKYRIELTEK